MLNVAKNFICAFSLLFAFGAIVFVFGVGPLFVLIKLGFEPFPFGLPIYFAVEISLIAAAYAFVQSREEKP